MALLPLPDDSLVVTVVVVVAVAAAIDDAVADDVIGAAEDDDVIGIWSEDAFRLLVAGDCPVGERFLDKVILRPPPPDVVVVAADSSVADLWLVRSLFEAAAAAGGKNLRLSSMVWIQVRRTPLLSAWNKHSLPVDPADDPEPVDPPPPVLTRKTHLRLV